MKKFFVTLILMLSVFSITNTYSEEMHKEYYDSGKIKEKRFYINDKEEGKSLFYDEKGKLIKTEIYKNGIKQ